MSKASIVLSVWESDIKNLADKKCYTFTNISLRDYIITKLTTPTTTVIQPSDSIDICKINWDAVDMMTSIKLNQTLKKNFHYFNKIRNIKCISSHL